MRDDADTARLFRAVRETEPPPGAFERLCASLEGRSHEPPPRLAPRLLAAFGVAALAVASVGLLVHIRASGSTRQQMVPAVAAPSGPKQFSMVRGDPSFVSPRLGWAVVDGQGHGPTAVYVTMDGGLHWTKQLDLGTSMGAGGLRFFDASTGIVVAASRPPAQPLERVYATHDGGATWQPQDLPASGAVTFDSPSDGWLLGVPFEPTPGGLNLIYRTADGGGHWTEVATADGAHGFSSGSIESMDLFAWSPIDAAIATVQSLSGTPTLHVTHDGGRTWRSVQVVPPRGVLSPPQPVLVTGLGFSDANHGVLLVDVAGVLPPSLPTGGTFRYTTTDGGLTWGRPSRLPLPVQKRAQDVVPQVVAGAWWAAQGNVVVTSADGGRTWARHILPLPAGYRADSVHFIDGRHGWVVAIDADFRDAEPQNGYAVPTHTILLGTDDGGAHWRRLAVPGG